MALGLAVLGGVLIVGLGAPATAQENLLEGHSAHGDAFNEGPRQAAYLMDRPDSVHFPVSSPNPEVQAFFDQGVGQLHGFWYLEAERSFRQIAALDPECAMAFWGMAMANVDNPERAAKFARAAWLKRGLADKRERMYIDSIARFHGVEGPEEVEELEEERGSEESEGDDRPTEAEAEEITARLTQREEQEQKKAERKLRQERAKVLVKDYEEIVWHYPDDIEAKAFLVNRIWRNQRHLSLPISSRHANEALLQEIFDVAPDHPAHHYRIHLWDSKDGAEYVVDSAVASGPSWPSTAHMWHMGGHIFARLGRHTEAAWQQEASARVDHAQMIRDKMLPDQIFNFAHNNEWLTRSMRHHGRVREAVALAKNMIELPRHPEYNHLEKSYCSATYGRRRLLETLELFEQWEELETLSQSMYLAPSEVAVDRGQRAYLLGKAHAYLGHADQVAEKLEALDRLIEEARDERAQELNETEDEALAGERKPEVLLELMGDVLEDHKRGLERLRAWRASLEALQIVLFEDLSAEDMEQQLDLLDENKFDAAHLAQLALSAGLLERAEELAEACVDKRDGQLYYHATRAHILWTVGEKEKALEGFDELRAWTARADLDLPVFQRLAPLAEERGLGSDWRAPDVPAEDVGERMDLAELGPLNWTPPIAPEWSRPDGFGNEIALSDYAGRPVLVIFFLGFKCVHCVEQLAAFAPATEAFAEAGIEIVTIGTNTAEQLADSLSTQVLPDDEVPSSEGSDFPFPILADPGFVAFKRYRAFDDFEKAPLHGTFLVDPAGKLRWQDVSFEPFMDWEFVLRESKRLLALSAETTAAADMTATPRHSAGGSSAPAPAPVTRGQ